MGRAFTIGLAAVATISLLVSCGSSDGDDTVARQVLSCISDEGGTLGEGADVAVVGGKALAVIGPVEATEALISQCLDLANSSDSDEARSNTPRVTVDEDAETDLVSRLLTVEQVEEALGGSGLSQADISETPVFENPDPRGPCGAVVPQFRLGEGTVGRSFGASNITIVQFITPTSTVTSAYLDAIVGDALPGCSAFESETNQGLMQQVSDIQIVDVTSAPTGAVAYTSRVDIGDQTAYVAAVTVADREVTTYLQVFAQDRIDSRALQALTAAANDALRRAE